MSRTTTTCAQRPQPVLPRSGLSIACRCALLAATVIVAIVAPHTAHADTVAITAASDNTLFKHNDGLLSSGAGPGIFAGNNSQSNTRRAVIAFAIADVIPSGATIDSVALWLNVSSAPNEIVRRVALHRVTSDWGEGASVSSGGSGGESADGDATWIHTFYPNSFWTTPGGDFDDAESAAIDVASSGAHVWSAPGMVADVQAWLDEPAHDFGWLVKGIETEPSTVRRFDSSEHSTVESRPTLYVRYTPATAPTSASTWGQVKGRFRE